MALASAWLPGDGGHAFFYVYPPKNLNDNQDENAKSRVSSSWTARPGSTYRVYEKLFKRNRVGERLADYRVGDFQTL
jgi:hypothetical protein